MEDKIIIVDGEEINVSKLSNEELIELRKEVKIKEKKYQRILEKYREQYDFLNEE